jgi:D-alanyl-D-alanine carboxypeptidase
VVNDDLRNYIYEERARGKYPEEIARNLLVAGWQEADVIQAIEQSQAVETNTQNISERSVPSRFLSPTGITLLFAMISLVFGGTSIYLWQDRLDLAATNSQKVRDFYAKLAESQVAFTDAGEMVFPDEQRFLVKKAEYIKDGTDFIEADLRLMRLTLYDKGVASATIPILTKGKERSWWETPTGDYKVLGKTSVGYSSIGNVWMPYSIQFYGNYLIHGWPYHDDGTPVPNGYSGGCIRLSTDDAKTVFNFARVEMPILVLEDNETPKFGALTPTATDLAPPTVGARSFLIANLANGETLVEKRAEDPLPIASLTKLMTAIVAHEVIYLGRPIKVKPNMLASVAQVFYPEVGGRYIGLDLLYPLLMQSSNDTANVLAGFLGEGIFVRDMNTKAWSLNMQDTRFADPSGMSANNISTADDLAKLLQYIYYKRPFLFDISKGVAFENVGAIKIGDTIPVRDLKNVNEFIGEPGLIGVKNGETGAARQTMVTVWGMHTDNGDVPVAIVVLGSEDRKRDTEILLNWLKKNFSVL